MGFGLSLPLRAAVDTAVVVTEIAETGPLFGLGQPAEPFGDIGVGDRGLQRCRDVLTQRCRRVRQLGAFERGAGEFVDERPLLRGQLADGGAIHRGVRRPQPLPQIGQRMLDVLIAVRRAG